MIVLAMSLALVNYSPVYAEESGSFVNGYEEDITYKEEITIKVGDTITLDDLEIVTPSSITFEPFEKTYDKVGTYNEEIVNSDGTKYPFTVFVESEGTLNIVGAKNITVTEGDKIDILNGVLTTKRADLKVSKYDKTLVDVKQNVTITAIGDDGEIVTKNIKLYIKNKPIKAVKKYVYTRCKVNIHIKPAYKTKNLGKISYNKKVKVTGVVKVGKYKWYRVKYNGKLGYVFINATSSKKLASIPKGFHVETKADTALQTQQSFEDMRESGKIDHNGKVVVDRGWK